MALSDKTVLITGAGGFIGHHIVNRFVEYGWKVYALVHRSLPDDMAAWEHVTRVHGDLLDPEIVNKVAGQMGERPSVVVHVAGLACDTGPDRLYRRLNYETVKEFARLPLDKLVYISSTDVYGIKDFNGESEDDLPYETKPLSPYPKYKIISEQWIRENMPPERYVILRPAAVYGEGDKTIGKRVVDFLSSSPFIIHFGKWKGQNIWPAADVVTLSKVALTVAGTSLFDGEAVNIVDQERVTMDEYYRKAAKEYLPGKRFKSVTLPFWVGKLLGRISTGLSNMLGKTDPVFDPSFYAVHHVASNLDFSCEKQGRVLKEFLTLEKQ